jgi:glutamate-ammonia-ligase adenylyltransferase
MSPGPALSLDQRIAAGPDADGARVRLERLRETGVPLPSDGDGMSLLAAILASGTFLPDLILGRPERLAGLLRDPWKQQAKPRAVFVRELEVACANVHSFAELQRALRDYAHGEMLRLGARELGVGLAASADPSVRPLPEHGLTLEVASELSALADACLESATRFCEAELRARHGVPICHDGTAGFSVIAMGKLGGEELNFSSDIDLIYIYASDEGQTDGQAGSLGLHDYYTRLSQAVTRAIAESTNEGFVFRVDLRLRPEGPSGTLCNSLAAAESYYETFGRTWERQALLRARPAAGDAWLGDRFLATVEPFVFPRTSGVKTIDDVRTLRRMFVATTAETSWNVKLGTGGIRDVELVAQVLQLLYAGKRRDLRERTTLPALHKLGLAGLLSDHEVRTLSDTYRLWRRIEHRLQLEHGQQTHSLPAEQKDMACLAQRLGYAGADELVARIAEGRAAVRAIADTLGDPIGGPPPRVLRMLAPTTTRVDVEDDLRAAGFRDVARAADNLETARARLPPAWLEEAIASPDPDRALAHFRDLALRASFGLFTLLREDRQLLRLLAGLFGTSERLSRHLVGHTEIWPSLTQELGVARPEEELWRAAFAARLVDCDDESALRRLRILHGEEILRIGLHDVAGDLDHEEVSAQLGRLAEACLQEAMQRVASALAVRFGRPDAELTILVLGSCGAREMRYGSDLELVFLYQRDGTTGAGMDHQEWFGRLAQRLIGALGALLEEGRLYSVDTRLRPSGSQGLLVTSYRAFEEYHREQAAPWERMALLRGRPACVLPAQGQTEPSDFAQRLTAIAYGHELPEAVLRGELLRMRRRIETERAGRGPLHLRFSPGGLTDLEFMAAWGQLRHGADDPALRTTSPYQALAHMAALGVLEAQALDAYRFLARTNLRLRLLRDEQDDRLWPDDESILARSLGLSRPQLKSELSERMAKMRIAFLKLLAA